MTARIRKSLCSNIALAGALAMAATCWAPTALALDLPSLKFPSITGNYYGGVGFGGSDIEPRVSESGFTVTDTTGSGTQLFFGRDVSARIAVEAYYSDLGAASLTDGETSGRIEYSTFGASGLLYLLGGGGVDSLANRHGFNLYARLGFGNLNNTGRGIEFDRQNAFNISTGLGAEYNLKNGFGLRTEFQNFDSDARVVTLNIVKRFRIQKGSGRFPTFLERADIPLPVSSKDVKAKAKTTLAKKDRDNDGVYDADDYCSSTKEGVSVDANGCDFSGVVDGVTFATGSAKLAGEGTEALDSVIAIMKKNPKVIVSIQAHTDNRGSAAANMKLSRKRAESVVRYLAETGELDLDRMSAIGYGESRPRKSNRTPEGRMANRRVEIETVR